MPRPLAAALPALLLVTYGALGLLALAYLAGILALSLKGGGVWGAALRVVLAGSAFIAWLYGWRLLTLYARSRLCGKREALDKR